MTAKLLGKRLIEALEAVTRADRSDTEAIQLHEPRFEGNESKYLQECLQSTYVSSVGPFVNRFERDLADYTGSAYAVAVVNGTSALHLALLLVGVQANDEVLVPALTFVATANAVTYCGATPHFVDSEEQTLGMDPHELRNYLGSTTEQLHGCCVNKITGRVIRAMVPMHTFGHPCDVSGLISVAHDFGISIVEDAAESLGSTIGGRHTGTFGKLGTLSFNGNKTITTGGGGAILCNEVEIHKRAKHLSTTAKIPHAWNFEHDEIGFNYRMPNLNAALGCAQLEQLPSFLAAKRELFVAYANALRDIPEVTLVSERQGCQSNYWLHTLLLAPEYAHKRDEILNECHQAGIMCRPAWQLMHRLPMYLTAPQAPLTQSESLAARIINIPSSPWLADRSKS